MGIQKDEAVIVTTDHMQAAQIVKFRAGMPLEFQHLLVGPVEGINLLYSFVLMPDGSKEGWEPSNTMNEVRTAFIALLQTLDADWAHLVLYDETIDRDDVIRTPYIAASSRWILNDEWYYERAKPNRYEPMPWQIRNTETNSLLAVYPAEHEAYVDVADSVRKYGRNAVRSWSLFHLLLGEPKTLVSGDALIDHALWFDEHVRNREDTSPERGEDDDHND